MQPTAGPMDYVILLLMFATLGVLLMGIGNMFRGKDPARGNRLMTWRVSLQALAILLAVLFLAKG